MTLKQTRWLIAVCAVCAVPATWAVAQEPSGAPTAEEQALERFCADQHPCVIINGHASTDPNAEPKLVNPVAALAAGGRPPSACPEIAAEYRARGIDPDAFVGPCPEKPPPSEDGRAP